MNKKTIIILSVLVLFLIIGGVSASETNTTDEKVSTTDLTVNETISSADDTMSEKISANEDNPENDNDLLSSSNETLLSEDSATFSVLKTEIENGYSSGHVTLQHKYYTYSNSISSNIGIHITKSIVIDGNGATIDCQNSCRAFWAYNVNNIVVKNINFINGYRASGYAHKTDGTIVSGTDNSRLSNTQYGGAIYLASTTGSKILNCNFTHMINLHQGTDNGGGAIALNGYSCTISNCNFNDCYSNAGGGINLFRVSSGGTTYMGNNNIIEFCNFEKCDVYWNGGAMEVYANDNTVKNCNFTDCIASINYENRDTHRSTLNTNGGRGGAIVYNSGAPDNDVINCLFKNNIAKSGGAIEVASGNTNCYIENCDFINNSAKKYNNNPGIGGALFFGALNGYVKNSNFINNSADIKGGAVYSAATGSTVDTCTFKNCTAETCNYFYQGQPITFINTYFPEVYVGNDNAGGDSLDPNSLGKFSTAMELVETGGTMYIVGSLTNFQNHEVTRGITIKPYTTSSNINLTSVSGRAFTISASDVTIRDLTITGSKYNGNGGVLYWNGDNAYIYNCTFQNNVLSDYTSSGKGGVIYVTGNSDIFTVEKCTFKDNKAYDGGAIYVDDVTDNTLIYNSVFTGNYVAHYGGALYYEGSICYYVDENTNRDFSGNYAAGNSLYANIYDGEATKCILDVYVSLNGGGDGSTFNTPTNFKNGFKLVAPNGKITFVKENEIFNLGEDYRISKFNVTFIGNHSTLNDASFTITPTSHSIKFYNLIFTGNSEYTIIWNGVDGIVENCIFKDNGGNNGLKGAAIQVYGNNLVIINSVFNNNQALSSAADGGAIWCNATNLNILHTNFTNNKASVGGTHIFLESGASYTLINNSNFINGIKTGTGSAVILTNGSLDICNSVFDGNTGEYGGALRLLNGTVNIDGSTFIRNQATYGGAIYSNIVLTLTNSNLTSNTANYGGALYINNKKVIMSDLRFENNYAYSGAAIYFNTTNEITFKNLSFISNTVRDNAIVYFTNSANVYNDEYVRFTNNNLGSGLLNTFVANNGKINATVFYVAKDATGTGLTWGKDATTLDYALEHIFENGKIFFSPGEYDLDKITITQNIALVGNQTTLKRKSADKYLFIPLSQFI